MIFIILWVVLAIFGIQAIASAKVSLSKSCEIHGKPARAIGVIALLTYPVTWIMGFCAGLYWGTTHPNEPMPTYIPFVICLAGAAVVLLAIAIVAFNSPKGKPEEPLAESLDPEASTESGDS